MVALCEIITIDSHLLNILHVITLNVARHSNIARWGLSKRVRQMIMILNSNDSMFVSLINLVGQQF